MQLKSLIISTTVYQCLTKHNTRQMKYSCSYLH